MMKSKRFYITLNPCKSKDIAILEFLKTTYSETETIKSILHQYVTDGCNSVNLGEHTICSDSNEEVLKDNNSIEKVQKGIDSTSSNNEFLLDDDIKNMFS